MLVSKSAANKVSTVPANQKLPPQYEAQFKQIIKFYEARNYKKALKSIDGILREHPNHGETIALKGLVLSSLDPTERATLKSEKSPTEYAKLGLSKHLNSYLCWQVFGLIHRSERNYREAVSCFRQATRHDPENIQLMRDLAMLQTQTRDFNGLLETRNRMLSLKPTIKLNWIGLAVAHYLCNNGEVAYHILEAFEKATSVSESPIQISELQLFKIQSLTKAHMYSEALACISRVESKVMDKPVLLSLKAECEMMVGDKDAAGETFVRILEGNLEDLNAVRGYVGSKTSFPMVRHQKVYHELSDTQRAEVLQILESLHTRLDGKSKLVQRECLDVCTAEQLRPRFSAFALPYIRKNIPSLYSAVKSLYLRVEFWAVIESVLLEWYDLLTSTGRFEHDEESTPTSLLWLLIMLAHHFCRLQDFPSAWKYLDEAIRHSPTMEHLYALKAKILKHQCKVESAAEAMKDAREMDLADRYLTNRTVKYLLRANQLEEAAVLYAFFSRAKVGSVLSNVIDFQAMWFELELADSLFRQGSIGQALSLYLITEKHFHDFYEDQVDFHGYCLRKYTLRAYMDLLEFSDNFPRHPIYRRTARRLLLCYVSLLDRARDVTPELDDVSSLITSHETIITPALGEILSERRVPIITKVADLKNEALRLARTLEKYDLPCTLLPIAEIVSVDDLNKEPSHSTAEYINNSSTMTQHTPSTPAEIISTLLLLSRVYLHHGLVVLAMRHTLSAVRMIQNISDDEGNACCRSERIEWETPYCTLDHFHACILAIQQGIEKLQRDRPGTTSDAIALVLQEFLSLPEIQYVNQVTKKAL